MKALFAVALAMLLASTALAEVPAPRNQVSVSIGDPGAIFLFNEIADGILTGIFTLGTVRYGDQHGGYLLTAAYERRLGRWNGVGVSGSWAYSSKRAYFRGEDIGKVERQLLAFTADWRAHWLRRSSVDLYSGLSAGFLNFSDELGAPGGGDDSETTLALQAVPLGARFGRAWGGSLETGIGTNGFVKLGLSRRF